MKNRAKGFTIIELMLIMVIIGILSIIAIPSYNSLRLRTFNATAKSSGTQFKSAQAIHNSQLDRFATEMDSLLKIDKNILDSPGVTFLWVAASSSGYTINVKHLAGTRWYTYQD